MMQILTNLGYSLNCEFRRPLLTVGGSGAFEWRSAEDMLVSDVLVMSKGIYPQKFVQNNNELEWDGDFAKFLGLYIAEGCFYKPGFTTMEISNCNPKIHEIVKSIGLSVTVRKNKKGILINDKSLIEKMMDWSFTTGAHKKYIPKMVLESGMVKEFLHGLWLGDGNVGKHASKNTNEAIYSTVSPILAKQVHILLLLFGIPSRLIFNSKLGTAGAFKVLITGDNVLRFVKELRIPKWKFTRPLVNVKNNPNAMLIPRIDDLSALIMKSVKGLSSWHRYSVSTKSYGRQFSRKSLQNFIQDAEEKGCKKYDALSVAKELCKDNYLFVTITKIMSEETKIFDIKFLKDGKFIINGFISRKV